MLMRNNKRSSNSNTRKPPMNRKAMQEKREAKIIIVNKGKDIIRKRSINRNQNKSQTRTNDYNKKDLKIDESDLIKLPVIKMSKSDMGRKSKGKKVNTSIFSIKPGRNNQYPSEAYQSHSSICTTHTGVLDTINEEKDEEKKKLLLSIFNTNFDLKKKINLSGFMSTKTSDMKMKNLLKKAQSRKLVEAPPKNALKLSKKLHSDLSIKTGYDSQISFTYSNLSASGKKSPKSVTRMSKPGYFPLPEVKNNVRYDPKQDRISKLQIERKRSLAKPKEDEELTSPFSKYSTRKRRNMMDGQLSYSNIATQLKTESSVPDFIKLDLKM